MDLWEVPATDVRAVLTRERSELLEWLDDLTPDEWGAPTAAPGWTVKDLALHLLDDDLGLLSRSRDGDRSGLLDAAAHGCWSRRWQQRTRRGCVVRTNSAPESSATCCSGWERR